MKRLLRHATSVFLLVLLFAGFCVLAAFLSSCIEGSDEYDVVKSSVISIPKETTAVHETFATDKTTRPIQRTLKTQLQTPVQQQSFSTQLQQQRALPSEMVPHASFLSEGDSSSLQRFEGTWSFSNSALSLIGLLEALIAIGIFSYRNRQGNLNLFTSTFMLRMFVLLLALISLIATSITSDFAKSAIVFDRMSLLIAILFLVQQVILFGARGRKAIAPANETTEKHFRAKRRYGD
jgi:hypothetical protein